MEQYLPGQPCELKGTLGRGRVAGMYVVIGEPRYRIARRGRGSIDVSHSTIIPTGPVPEFEPGDEVTVRFAGRGTVLARAPRGDGRGWQYEVLLREKRHARHGGGQYRTFVGLEKLILPD